MPNFLPLPDPPQFIKKSTIATVEYNRICISHILKMGQKTHILKWKMSNFPTLGGGPLPEPPQFIKNQQ